MTDSSTSFLKSASCEIIQFTRLTRHFVNVDGSEKFLPGGTSYSLPNPTALIHCAVLKGERAKECIRTIAPNPGTAQRSQPCSCSQPQPSPSRPVRQQSVGARSLRPRSFPDERSLRRLTILSAKRSL